MKRTMGVEKNDTESNIETESLIRSPPGGITDHEVENSSSVSVISEVVARQIRAVVDLLTQKLAHLCELARYFSKNECHGQRVFFGQILFFQKPLRRCISAKPTIILN